MNCYWRFKRLFAVYIEFSKEFGCSPFLRIKNIKNELIVEIPYGYVIITPRTILLNEHPAYQQKREDGMSIHEKRDRGILGASTGITKN